MNINSSSDRQSEAAASSNDSNEATSTASMNGDTMPAAVDRKTQLMQQLKATKKHSLDVQQLLQSSRETQHLWVQCTAYADGI